MKHLGKHLVFDLWDCVNLNSAKVIEEAMLEAVKACKATLLEIKTHTFSPQGVSGFVLLSESHISIHTWPEHKYAAIDIFTCGERVVPYNALPVFRKFFKPKHVEIVDVKRGTML
ncbi:MAG: adenosylmethionine decarboxylase [Candidatus Portnoybacteria bacterium]|nr:adenosylmethionine decarboxylase [Candidatus Portnoybacteria bacterium]